MSQAPTEHAGLALSSHYQPIYSLAHRRSVGIEALLRGKHAGRPVMPAQAFELMDSPEACHQLDLAMLRTHAANVPPLTDPLWLFLNVHPASLMNLARAEAVAEAITANGLAPQSVVLEVQEHTLGGDDMLQQCIRRLRKQGFLIAIDDFGVGHSHLDRICEMEPDLVKFDRHLLRSAASNPRIRNLVCRLVHLMHESGALVIQEGIENDSDVLVALESGCDLVQGDYVARPGLKPEHDDLITPRIDARWDELMVRDLLKRKITRRQLELARQSFVQSAILLMQNTPFDEAARPMLSMPNVLRCFLLDSEGRQLGRNLNTKQAASQSTNPKFAPLADTTGAVWSRRAYFQHAIDQPGVLYMSEPYLSMTDTRTCVTLSMAIEIDESMHVLCTDMLAPSSGYEPG
ncbi:MULTISPECIES: EAL domain-containing protein [unclassified Paludibacterium]|uniref:sensor domain-containing phosphodiesterase n=1 Tax=unclassified Paludibacterium TaxID=2618429 RepID=UPI001C044A79|nr:EAL domain-containing protein [Paludibacterium sp. B53371]BEV73028.1 EAL domain-containing protein [Paludibacterium sp. THUN1379]